MTNRSPMFGERCRTIDDSELVKMAAFAVRAAVHRLSQIGRELHDSNNQRNVSALIDQLCAAERHLQGAAAAGAAQTERSSMGAAATGRSAAARVEPKRERRLVRASAAAPERRTPRAA